MAAFDACCCDGSGDKAGQVNMSRCLPCVRRACTLAGHAVARLSLASCDSPRHPFFIHGTEHNVCAHLPHRGATSMKEAMTRLKAQMAEMAAARTPAPSMPSTPTRARGKEVEAAQQRAILDNINQQLNAEQMVMAGLQSQLAATQQQRKRSDGRIK